MSSLTRGELGREDAYLELLIFPESRGAGLCLRDSPFRDEEDDLGESDDGVCCLDDPDEVLSLVPLPYVSRRGGKGGEASCLLLSDLA